jgi:hypothetical protein
MARQPFVPISTAKLQNERSTTFAALDALRHSIYNPLIRSDFFATPGTLMSAWYLARPGCYWGGESSIILDGSQS